MIFLDGLTKNTKISNFIKMRPVGADLFRADGRTAMMKLLFALRGFANAPKIERSAHTVYLCLLYGSENKQSLFSCTPLITCYL